MELRHLRYFKSVADSGGLSPSAQRLHIAASAIGDTIRDLEDELGVQLFDRSSRSLKLTPLGAAFYEDASKLLQNSDAAILRIRRLSQGEIGHLRIGFFSGGFGTFAPKMIGKFRRSHKGISIHLTEMVPSKQVEALLDGSIEVAFTRPGIELANANLASEPFQKEPLYAVLPQGHRLARGTSLSILDLRDDPFVINERHNSPALFDRIHKLCTDANFSPLIAATASASIGVAALVEAGEGVAVLTQTLRAAESTLRFLPLTDEEASIDIVVAWSPRHENAALNAFLQHIGIPQRK